MPGELRRIRTNTRKKRKKTVCEVRGGISRFSGRFPKGIFTIFIYCNYAYYVLACRSTNSLFLSFAPSLSVTVPVAISSLSTAYSAPPPRKRIKYLRFIRVSPTDSAAIPSHPFSPYTPTPGGRLLSSSSFFCFFPLSLFTPYIILYRGNDEPYRLAEMCPITPMTSFPTVTVPRRRRARHTTTIT